MSAMTALDRLRRLLAVIPWVAGSDGVDITAIVDRFDYPRDELLEDLKEVVWFVGVHPFTYDCLLEMTVDDERLWIRYGDWFRRPMKLDTAEIVALHAAGRSVAALADGDEMGPLERALTKLSAGLAVGGDKVVEVRLGSGFRDLLDQIRNAIARSTALEIDYYSYGRDSAGTRLVEPHRYHADKGHWYMSGYCHEAGGQRMFRLDRISRCSPTGIPFSREPNSWETAGEDPVGGIPVDGSLPEVFLELDAAARWVVEEYPHTGLEEVGSGRVRVSLPVSTPSWLERLLLRLGPSATIIRSDERVGLDVRTVAAERLLRRYDR